MSTVRKVLLANANVCYIQYEEHKAVTLEFIVISYT